MGSAWLARAHPPDPVHGRVAARPVREQSNPSARRRARALRGVVPGRRTGTRTGSFRPRAQGRRTGCERRALRASGNAPGRRRVTDETRRQKTWNESARRWAQASASGRRAKGSARGAETGRLGGCTGRRFGRVETQYSERPERAAGTTPAVGRTQRRQTPRQGTQTRHQKRTRKRGREGRGKRGRAGLANEALGGSPNARGRTTPRRAGTHAGRCPGTPPTKAQTGTTQERNGARRGIPHGVRRRARTECAGHSRKRRAKGHARDSGARRLRDENARRNRPGKRARRGGRRSAKSGGSSPSTSGSARGPDRVAQVAPWRAPRRRDGCAQGRSQNGHASGPTQGALRRAANARETQPEAGP